MLTKTAALPIHANKAAAGPGPSESQGTEEPQRPDTLQKWGERHSIYATVVQALADKDWERDTLFVTAGAGLPHFRGALTELKIPPPLEAKLFKKCKDDTGKSAGARPRKRQRTGRS